ncbi:CheY-like superfamily [Penicillium sp. IBT 35674x]|nr:CheY-like superfamily [Penicillium sp. IBT 35674x]
MDFNFDSTAAQQLADMLPHGLAILDHRYEIISVNSRFRELIMCSNVKFSACWSRSVHVDDIDRVITHYNEALSSKEDLRVEYRTKLQWCLMTLNPVVGLSQHLCGLDAYERFIVTIVDITPQKKAEIAQRQLYKDAQYHKERQERYIDMISHEIRNPLTAMLHCTEDIIEVLRATGEDAAPLSRITKSAETIGLCIAHQKRILDDVLTLSKIDASMLSLSPQNAQPTVWIENALCLFRPEIKKKEIQFDYLMDLSYADCEIKWVMADLDRMGQVLNNLLSNAIKFTARCESKRRIRVTIGASRERPSSYPSNIVFFGSDEAVVGLDPTNSPEWGNGEFAYIMIAVADSGIGISDDAQMRVFERFNQATPMTEIATPMTEIATPMTEILYGGSGLGLNISRNLCHLHGGDIGVSSREGEGSTFGFFFRVRRSVDANYDRSYDHSPSILDNLLGYIICRYGRAKKNTRTCQEPRLKHVEEFRPNVNPDESAKHLTTIAKHMPAHNKESHPSYSKGKSSLRILLVEDNIINRTLLSRKLESLKFHVIEAGNGREALHIAQNSTLDCILMDHEMPGVDGTAATKMIRGFEKSVGAYTPILGVTANSGVAQQAEMVDAGMDFIIHKPYRTEELIAKITHMITSGLRIEAACHPDGSSPDGSFTKGSET